MSKALKALELAVRYAGSEAGAEAKREVVAEFQALLTRAERAEAALVKLVKTLKEAGMLSSDAERGAP